jgi:signal transduction histidine kinase
MVAHELNTPLAAIGMLARLVANDRLDPAARTQAAAAIQTEVGLLRTLVADVQSAASVERDDFQVRLRPVPLSVLLADAAAFAATLPGDHPLALWDAAGVLVLADPERIGQVLRNLLGNAAKYTPPGTPIELRAVPAGGQVRVAVADQGPGIHPDDLRRIFEKFGRGRDQASRTVAGLGLGLYLSRRILQAHDSALTVESTPGQGSVFAFSLEVAS